ncbi:U4/U6 small nuclear ribonucleoprotein prp4 [Hypocenomyce scalaris]|nr:U4/U6 small nuclear ribonucleoprotein prp4 [Hypocenomyce scalaris]
MTSRSPSTPSEGEIVESDSEKATTSLPSVNGISVDRHSREERPSVSRSPSPVPSPRRRKSRTRSRSPYREPRGTKRTHLDSLAQNRSRNDPRRFKVHYEEQLHDGKRRLHTSYTDLDRGEGFDSSLRYDDRGSSGRPHAKRPRTRSRSPPRPPARVISQGQRGRTEKNSRSYGYGERPRGDHGHGGSNSRQSEEQSVRDRGLLSIAAASSIREAETQDNQTPRNGSSTVGVGNLAAEFGVSSSAVAEKPVDSPVVDEATMIEERRKKREAIKAKYRGQATPMLVQALALSNRSDPTTPKPESPSTHSPAPGSPQVSPPQTPQNTSGQNSPTVFSVLKDEDLANNNTEVNGKFEDEPSAADYDPTMDMQEDKMRHDQRHQADDLPSGAYDETKTNKQDVLLPDAAIEKPKPKKPTDDFDMFAEDDEGNMFVAGPSTPPSKRGEEEPAKAVPVPQAKALDMSMLDDWDDSDGYYKVILGELLDGRYHVQSNLGKGMFSGVVRSIDQKGNRLVAIKLIRNNETMKKAGLKEIEILQKLNLADPEDKKHMIRLERHFEHKGHLCMVFENLSINLREVLKKFGRDVGINLKAVRAYAQQMFLGLSLLRKCNILHADLKPDNVLVNESRNLLKICDLGSASDASDNEITPYLVSRFYRAPEIILGMPYDFAIDMWSVGCTLFELYTGKILFTGRTNNQMLRSIMECRGKFSHKILRRAQFAGLHFDDLLNFRSVEKDKLTGKDVVRILNFTKPTRDLRTRLLTNAKGMSEWTTEMKELNMFVDLLDRCLNLNPEKRCTPAEALKHPFIMRSK